MTPLAAMVMLFAANCGGGGSQSNPPAPNVVIEAVSDLVDVGERFVLSGAQTTDPNDPEYDEFVYQWRFVLGGAFVEFDDYCKNHPTDVCTSNNDDYCSNDTTTFCNEDSDCINFGTCDTNSGTSSDQCATGICNLEEGDKGVNATFLASVAGPYTVRLVVEGSESNGVQNRTFDTYPSLYVAGSPADDENALVQFGGTKGALIGEVTDAAEYAGGTISGAANPVGGDLVVIDPELKLVRVFSLRSGSILGAFGDSTRIVNDPAALTFQPGTGRLFVVEQTGRVLVFDGVTGFLVKEFGNVGAGAKAIRFSPTTGNLLVVNGQPGGGVLAFDATNGQALGVLGDTDVDVDTAVDLDFLGEDAPELLIADQTGSVVRCDSDGNNCGPFSAALDAMLASGSPSAIAVSPSAEYVDADVMIADPVGEQVISCDSDGENCATFGETGDLDSLFEDVFFAPPSAPTTTTSTTTTTTLAN